MTRLRNSDVALVAGTVAEAAGKAARAFRIKPTRRIMPDRHGYVICRDIQGIIRVYWRGPTRDGSAGFSHKLADGYPHRFEDAARAAVAGNRLPPDCQVLRVRL